MGIPARPEVYIGQPELITAFNSALVMYDPSLLAFHTLKGQFIGVNIMSKLSNLGWHCYEGKMLSGTMAYSTSKYYGPACTVQNFTKQITNFHILPWKVWEGRSIWVLLRTSWRTNMPDAFAWLRWVMDPMSEGFELWPPGRRTEVSPSTHRTLRYSWPIMGISSKRWQGFFEHFGRNSICRKIQKLDFFRKLDF